MARTGIVTDTSGPVTELPEQVRGQPSRSGWTAMFDTKVRLSSIAAIRLVNRFTELELAVLIDGTWVTLEWYEAKDEPLAEAHVAFLWDAVTTLKG